MLAAKLYQGVNSCTKYELWREKNGLWSLQSGIT